MTNYWLLVSDEETWVTLIKSGYWGLKKLWKRKSRKIKHGDKAVAYVKFFSAIFGTVEIISDPYYDENVTELGALQKYPIRFKIKPDIFLAEPITIRPLIKDLSFIRNKKKWYAYFQTSIRSISKQDFELIVAYLRRNLK
jgi:predicted RNA-binding protein